MATGSGHRRQRQQHHEPLYQHRGVSGEIFDPQTQTTVNGEVCRFPFATGQCDPRGRVDPVAKNLLSYFPQPNQNTSLGINGDYYYVVPTPYPATRIFGRIDYQFNDKNG